MLYNNHLMKMLSTKVLHIQKTFSTVQFSGLISKDVLHSSPVPP